MTTYANWTELNAAIMVTEDEGLLREMLTSELTRSGGSRLTFVKRIKHRISRVLYLRTMRELEG